LHDRTSRERKVDLIESSNMQRLTGLSNCKIEIIKLQVGKLEI